MNKASGSRRSRLLRVLLLSIVSLAGVVGAWGPSPSMSQAAADTGYERLSVMRLAPAASDYSLAQEQAFPLLATTVFTTPAPVLPPPQGHPVPAPAAASEGKYRYFSQTAHFLRGPFLSYWETHGATAVLGLPITDALLENGLAVQYLERARLEWHPEISSDPRKQVLLTRLGVIMTEARGQSFPRLPSGSNTETSHFFAETGHNLANAFLEYWQRNGGLAVFGYPISEEIVETNAADGKQYTVQYFERNRFEYHPEERPAFKVQIGLMGVEYARMIGLNPMSRTLVPGPFVGSDEDMSDSPRLDGLVDKDLMPVVQALGRTPQFRWIPPLIIKNNIHVEFQEVEEEGVAGAFVATRSRTRPYVIIIPESERGESIESIASVIAHESTHAYDVITGVLPRSSGCSIEAELRSFMNGLTAWVLLKGDDALARTYPRTSFDYRINRSLKGFNNDKDRIEFDFDVQAGRSFLREVYGGGCGR